MENKLLSKINVYMQYNPAHHGIDIWFEKDGGDGKVLIAKPLNIEFEEVNPYGYIEPTMMFDKHNGYEFLKSFATGIVECGIEIDAIKYKKDEMSAVKEHLADMRKLVFEGIPVNLTVKKA